MEKVTLLGALLVVGCATTPQLCRSTEGGHVPGGLAMVQAATANRQYCAAFAGLKGLGPEVAPEQAQQAREALVAGAAAEVERLRALKQMVAWEEALLLALLLAEVDPSRRDLPQTIQEEFDAFLWQVFLKMNPPPPSAFTTNKQTINSPWCKAAPEQTSACW